jgi:hypothetical protein
LDQPSFPVFAFLVFAFRTRLVLEQALVFAFHHILLFRDYRLHFSLVVLLLLHNYQLRFYLLECMGIFFLLRLAY